MSVKAKCTTNGLQVVVNLSVVSKNRGAGAGGSNTNKNGLLFEKNTLLDDKLNVVERVQNGKAKNSYYLKVDLMGRHLLKVEKGGLKSYLESRGDFNKNCEKHLQPDEALIDAENKIIYVLEKKFQTGAGSVDEKLQTGLFKKEFYEEQYQDYCIRYAYVLSDWFKKDKYNPEMRFLKKYNIPVFWASSENYFQQIVEWLSVSSEDEWPSQS